MKEQKRFMQRAVKLSIDNVRNGGGPFGAVIVKDGEVIAEGVNRVTANLDPTAHAEVSAIRAACHRVGDFRLKGCTDKIYYGNTKEDADAIGFSDDVIYKEFTLPLTERTIPMRPLMRHEAQQAFREWEEKEDKVEY